MPSTSSTSTLPRNVNRWRHRLNPTVAMIRAMATKNITQPVATRSTARAACTSHSVRRWATARRIAVSMRSVSRRSGAEKRATTIQATSTTRPTIHARPVRPMFRGSGGGAPVGRRRPGVRRTVGGTDEVDTPVPPSPIAGSIGRRRHRWPANQAATTDVTVVLIVAELAVQVAHGLGRQSRRGRVDDIGDPGTPPIDQLGADQRRDVLGRLQPAIVGELDEVRVVEDRIGGEQQTRRRCDPRATPAP